MAYATRHNVMFALKTHRISKREGTQKKKFIHKNTVQFDSFVAKPGSWLPIVY